MSLSSRAQMRGNASLLLCFFLPLLFAFGSLAFDLSAISSQKNTLQNELDRIALEAARRLPSDSALIFAKEQLGRGPLQNLETTVERGPQRSSIALRAKGDLSPGIFELTAALFGAKRKRTYSAESSAQLAPVDLALILPDGVTMKPWTARKASWGDPQQWPVATFIKECAKAPISLYANAPLQFASEWTEPEGQRWLTQSCQNPLFTSIKLAAMSIVESTLSIGSNRMSVIFTPGDTSGAEVIRHIRGDIGGYHSDTSLQPLAHSKLRTDGESFLGDSLCMFIGDSRFNYPLEGFSINNLLASRCSTPVLSPRCGEPFSPWEGLSEECIRNASVQERIYWRAALHPSGSFNAQSDILSALERAASELLDSGDDIEMDRTVRGNLATNPERMVVILTDSLPEIDQSSPPAPLQALLRAGVSMTIAIFLREGFSASPLPMETQPAILQWQELLNTHKSERSSNHLLLVQSQKELSEVTVPLIHSLTRRIVLKS